MRNVDKFTQVIAWFDEFFEFKETTLYVYFL